ncbi:HAD-like domain-containing protein [Aspergillus aurantiobrunneus]
MSTTNNQISSTHTKMSCTAIFTECIATLGALFSSLCSATSSLLSTPNCAAAKPKMVIFDFDGTLMHTVDAIMTTWDLTFKALFPVFTPSSEDLHRLISAGTPAAVTFETLWPAEHRDKLDVEECVKVFREIYTIHGLPLQRPFPFAKDVLLAIAERGIPIAIVSNKGTEVIKRTMQDHGLTGLVPDEFIIGDPLYGANRKPHPAAYTNVLVPRFQGKLGEDLLAKEGDVLVVGDTVSDIKFAQNIGAKVCWCQFGDGDKQACEQLAPDFAIDELAHVLNVIEAL